MIHGAGSLRSEENTKMGIKKIVSFLILIVTLSPNLLFAQSAEAKMVSSGGEVKIFKKATQEWKTLDSSSILEEGDSLKTGPLSNVILELTSSRKIGLITLSEDTEFYFETFRYDLVNAQDEVLLYLGKGKVLVDIDWVRNDLKFEVKTPTAWAGTRDSKSFEVAVSPEIEEPLLPHPSPSQKSFPSQSSTTSTRKAGVYP